MKKKPNPIWVSDDSDFSVPTKYKFKKIVSKSASIVNTTNTCEEKEEGGSKKKDEFILDSEEPPIPTHSISEESEIVPTSTLTIDDNVVTNSTIPHDNMTDSEATKFINDFDLDNKDKKLEMVRGVFVTPEIKNETQGKKLMINMGKLKEIAEKNKKKKEKSRIKVLKSINEIKGSEYDSKNKMNTLLNPIRDLKKKAGVKDKNKTDDDGNFAKPKKPSRFATKMKMKTFEEFSEMFEERSKINIEELDKILKEVNEEKSKKKQKEIQPVVQTKKEETKEEKMDRHRTLILKMKQKALLRENKIDKIDDDFKTLTNSKDVKVDSSFIQMEEKVEKKEERFKIGVPGGNDKVDEEYEEKKKQMEELLRLKKKKKLKSVRERAEKFLNEVENKKKKDVGKIERPDYIVNPVDFSNKEGEFSGLEFFPVPDNINIKENQRRFVASEFVRTKYKEEKERIMNDLRDNTILHDDSYRYDKTRDFSVAWKKGDRIKQIEGQSFQRNTKIALVVLVITFVLLLIFL